MLFIFYIYIYYYRRENIGSVLHSYRKIELSCASSWKNKRYLGCSCYRQARFGGPEATWSKKRWNMSWAAHVKQQNLGHGPGGLGIVSLSTNSCLPIPLVLLTMLGMADGGAAARAPRQRTMSRPRTERTGVGEDTGGGEYEGWLVWVQGGPVELPPPDNVW